MKKTTIKSPISLLISFADEDISPKVEEYLSKNKLYSGIIFKGKGTAESDIADIFGFGMCDKEVIVCAIPNDRKEKIMSDINDITRVDTDRYGLNIVLKIGSATSNLLELMNIKVVD